MRNVAKLNKLYAGGLDPKRGRTCAGPDCSKKPHPDDPFCSSPCASAYFKPIRVKLGDPA